MTSSYPGGVDTRSTEGTGFLRVRVRLLTPMARPRAGNARSTMRSWIRERADQLGKASHEQSVDVEHVAQMSPQNALAAEDLGYALNSGAFVGRPDACRFCALPGHVRSQ
jgi:hypothetical protein